MDKHFLAFCGFILALACVQVTGDDSYTTKWDNINVDEILKSDRLLINYKKCLMDQGTCTPDAAELRRNLPEALEEECQKCSEKQKANTDKIIKFLIEKKPDLWKQLGDKYDPDKKYYNRHYGPNGEKLTR